MDEGENFIGKGRSKLQEVTESVKRSLEDDSNSTVYAGLAYIPVVGPLVVFLFKREQKLVRFHAVNAIYMQSAFFSIWLAIWLLESIPILSNLLKLIGFVPFITNAIMYTNTIWYVLASLYGYWKGSNKELWETPFLNKFLKKHIVDYFSKKDEKPKKGKLE